MSIMQQHQSREPFLAFVDDEATLTVLREAATQNGWRPESCKSGTLRSAVQSLSVMQSPKLLLVDLTEADDPLSQIDHLAEVCEPGTIVLTVGQTNDVGFYKTLLAKGIRDYLPKPITLSALNDAIERTARPSDIAEDDATSNGQRLTCAVIGSRGGVGASTVATSIAWLASEEHKRSTALLDLDIHFGTGSLIFDIEPGRGLIDAVDDPLRIDNLFIDRAMAKVSDSLSIMSAEAPLDCHLMTDGQAFARLGHELRENYELTVIDMPRHMILNFPHLLEKVDTIVVVIELTLASARDTIRLLGWLKKNAANSRTIIVANNVAAGQSEVSQKDFSGSIEQNIEVVIPYDRPAVLAAARQAQPLAQSGRKNASVGAMRDLSTMLLQNGSQDTSRSKIRPGNKLAEIVGKLKSTFAKQDQSHNPPTDGPRLGHARV